MKGKSMSRHRKPSRLIFGLFVLTMMGCTPRQVTLNMLCRPVRAPQLDALNVFVGNWTWQAEILHAEPAVKNWSGTASWGWALDNRCLKGEISSQSGNTRFNSSGIWSWDQRARRFAWSMYNDWGHPQQGTATYDEDTKKWVMSYRSIGLDGTKSQGRYIMRVVNNDTLEWEMVEWADRLHFFKKMEMKGTYNRKK